MFLFHNLREHVDLFYETSRDLIKRFQKWTPVTSRGMTHVGLRVLKLIYVLVALSTNPAVATKGLQTNETEPEDLQKTGKDLNDWKEKSATIIHRLPGLLTKSVGGNFTLRFLKLTETKTEKNEMKKEDFNGMIRRETLGRLCKFLNQLRLKVVKRITRAKLKRMKQEMTKQRMRGLLPKIFSRVHLPRYKEGQNKIDDKKVKSFCFNLTELMKEKAKQDFNSITI